MKISIYVRIHIKIIPWKFRILYLKSFILSYLPVTETIEYVKWNIKTYVKHTWTREILRLRMRNSGFYFYLNWNKLEDIQICISVPLTLFRIDLFGTIHGWRRGDKKPPPSPKSVTHILHWWNLAQLYVT